MKCPTHLQPLMRWPGGKSRVSKKLIRMFPPHETYVEPFAGGAAVFFAKPLVKKNVISDADPWPIDLYKDVRKGALRRCNGGIRASQGLFRRAKKSKRACEKLALALLSFHGNRRQYGTRKYDGRVRLRSRLAKAPCYEAKLRKTTILRGDFAKVMRRYDSCKTLHFLDPPWPMEYSDLYHAYGGPKHGKHRNKNAFGKAMDPEHVFRVANAMKGTVVVIYNWSPKLAKIFRKKGWTLKKIYALTQKHGGGNEMRPNLVAIKRSRCAR